MTTHSAHPTDAASPVLAEDCERCAEHAEHITSLDDLALRRLFALVYRVERQGHDHYRNPVEAQAGRHVWEVAVALNRVYAIPLRTLLLGEIEPAAVRMGFDG